MSSLPPERLMRRVGWDVFSRRPGDVFEERGSLQWQLVKALVGEDWSFAGKRVLDFGCGSGRILMPAIADEPEAEFLGCDIHAPSVAWLREHVPAPERIFQTGDWPPMDQPDGRFDLIYAFSVFTHLLDSWSAWLLELHRLLADDGLLAVTVFGPGQYTFGEEPVSEESVGMNVLYPSAPWDTGGPLILHSEWWLRAHWGRVFDIVLLRLGDQGGAPPLFGQGVLVMRKRPGSFTVEELERPEADEPRELLALRGNVLSLRREIARHSVVLNSRSWRLTAPLRVAARRIRGR
jgi:SAM-dependent methyltransferase